MRPIHTFLICVVILAGCGGGGGSRNAQPQANRAPQIGTAETVTVDANSVTQSLVTLADDRTAVDALVVAFLVSDPNLLPEGAVSISTLGSERALDIRPALDEVGTARIDLTVRDAEGLTSSQSLNVEVLSLQRTAADFTRSLATVDEADLPTFVNAIDFVDDAEADEFSDLLGL